MLDVPRRLDLGRPRDREVLKQLLMAAPDVPNDLADVVDTHSEWFATKEWRHVHSGGLSFNGRSIVTLLENTKRLVNLCRFGSVDHYLSAMTSPQQLSAALFEVTVADWLTSRRIHRAFVFEPPVKTRTSVKHPEFLWLTSLGELYVECKVATPFLTEKAEQLSRLTAAAKALADRADGWPKDARVDLVITPAPLNGCEDRMRDVILRLAAVGLGGTAQDGEVSGAVVARDEPAPLARGYLRQMVIEVGPTPTRLDESSSHLTVAIPFRRAADRQARALLREARRGLLQVRLTPLWWDALPPEGCLRAEEVPSRVQA